MQEKPVCRRGSCGSRGLSLWGCGSFGALSAIFSSQLASILTLLRVFVPAVKKLMAQPAPAAEA